MCFTEMGATKRSSLPGRVSMACANVSQPTMAAAGLTSRQTSNIFELTRIFARYAVLCRLQATGGEPLSNIYCLALLHVKRQCNTFSSSSQNMLPVASKSIYMHVA